IASVYGLEEDGDSMALVMELVEGETLQDRISRGRIPVDEAARIGLELAKAIEFAHEKGIVHRDLKPANVMLDAEGHVKVLDFGLAKALEEEKTPQDLSESPTLTAMATQAGIILGTAAYMSPEQAVGSNIDRRADIWSYGVVLFEMISGRQQFAGETLSHTMAAVLKDEPDWEDLPTHLPSRIVELLRRCLQKDPKQRLQSIGEARVMWENYIADPDSFQVLEAHGAVGSAAPSSTLSRLLPWSIAALALAALAFVYFGSSNTANTTTGTTSQRLTIPLPGTTNFMEYESSPPVISPDGQLIVYGMVDDTGIEQLWIRPIDSFEARPIKNTSGARFPFWSPDSRHVGYFTGKNIRRLEIATGRFQTVGSEVAFVPRGASWTTTDQILFSPSSNSPILMVDAAGGEARPATTLDPNVIDASHRWPHALPDGKHFLFTVWTNDADALAEFGGVYLGVIDGSSAPRRLVPNASSATYATSGHILAMQESDLVAIPFDAKKLEVTGDAFVVADEVLINRNTGYGSFSTSEEGTLVFARGSGNMPDASYLWANREGELTKTPVDAAPMFTTYAFHHLRLSPDATQAATTFPGPTGDPEVWVLDLIRGVRSRLTPSASYSIERPIWSPAGDRILYVSVKSGTWDLFIRNADGSGEEESFLASEYDKTPLDWQGDQVLYWVDSNVEGAMLVIYDISTGESNLLYKHTGSDRPRPRFSPDGKYLLYDTIESDRSEVILYQLEGGARWQVSTNGGRYAHMSEDMTEIIYLDLQQRVIAVDVTIDASGVSLGTPRELFQIVENVVAWDLTSDHSRFLLATQPKQVSEPIHVVLNWDAK
ncbi:MAG: protein kinase, partial [Candidatus Eisenbacteria bacterium]|nr:protein kinase [Candidatus Eisenbacteria bacterium]